MSPDFALGKRYAGELFAIVGFDFTAEAKGNPAPSSLVIDNQAVITLDREAGELRLQVYSICLTVIQLLNMLVVGG